MIPFAYRVGIVLSQVRTKAERKDLLALLAAARLFDAAEAGISAKLDQRRREMGFDVSLLPMPSAAELRAMDDAQHESLAESVQHLLLMKPKDQLRSIEYCVQLGIGFMSGLEGPSKHVDRPVFLELDEQAQVFLAAVRAYCAKHC